MTQAVMAPVTVQDVQAMVRSRYRPTSFISKLILQGRSNICPFHTLANFVPRNSTVLDIGCGNGLFLNLLDNQGRLKSGTGFDVSERAIDAANRALGNVDSAAPISFLRLSNEEAWPEDVFDVVSMIDVMHHIAPWQQKEALLAAAAHVKPGGILLYKDMSTRSVWRAWANRLHDLLSARQWINYVPAAIIKKWAGGAGFTLIEEQILDLLWYKHEILVYRKSV